MEHRGDGGLDEDFKSFSSVALKILMVQERIEEKLDSLLARRTLSKVKPTPTHGSPAKLPRMPTKQPKPGSCDTELQILESESAVSYEWRSFKGEVQTRNVFERWFLELDEEGNFEDAGTDLLPFDLGCPRNHPHRLSKIVSREGGFFGYIPIHPHSTFLVFWSVSALLVLMMQLTYVPLDLGWEINLGFIPTIIAVFWSLDACLRLLTGTYNADGEKNPIRISARDYALSSFPLDLFLVLMDWISALDVGAKGGVGLLRVSKVARAFRMITILRMSKISRNVTRVMAIAPLAKRSRMIFRVLYLCVAFLWFLHFVACVWFLIGKIGFTDDGDRWLDLPIPMADGTIVDLRTQGFDVQYVFCFHWSVATFTLGNMEVGYANTFERVFGIALTIISFLFGSVIISLLSAIFLEHQNACMENTIKLRNVYRFLVENEVSNILALRIQKVCHERVNTVELLTFSDTKALETLPASLYQELRYEILGRFLNKHDLFHCWSIVNLRVAQEYSVDGVEIILMKPGDGLFKAHADSDSAYFFSRGALRYSKSDSHSDSDVVLVPADTWLSEAALWSHWRHVGTCEAQSRSRIAVVSCERLVHHVQRYPTIRAITASYCQFFCQGLALAKTPTSELPDDLRVPFTKFGELLAHFPNHLRIFLSTQAIKASKFGKTTGWELEKEVNEGNCVAYIDVNDELELAVVLIALMLENDQGETLYQVGKFVPIDVLNEFGEEERKWEVVPELKLPDLKRDPGELPEDTLRRLVERKMSVLKDKFEHIRTRVDEEVCVSEEHRVKTRYFRTRIVASMRDAFTAKPVVKEINLGDTSPRTPQPNRLFIRESNYCSDRSREHSFDSCQSQAMETFTASKPSATGRKLREFVSLSKISLYVIFEERDSVIYAWLSRQLADTFIRSARRDRDEVLTQLLCTVNLGELECAHSLDRFFM